MRAGALRGLFARLERPIGYSPRHFAIFRIALGLYLVLFTGLLIPHAATLLSREGMVPDPSVNITAAYFMNPLEVADSPEVVTLWMATLSFCAMLVTIGVFRRTAAVLLWFGLAAAFNRNNQLWSPALPLVGWLLLALAVIPNGEPWSAGRKPDRPWHMPPLVFWGAWIVTGVSYSVSGFFKAAGPSWIDGTAIRQTLEWTWARNWWYTELMLQGPAWITVALTYGTLFLELLYAPLSLHRYGRIAVWTAAVLMHLNILLLIDLVDLTTGVLLMHLFTFEPAWYTWRRGTPASSAEAGR